MLDLKFIRENPEIVKQNIKNKFQDKKLPLVDELIALDEENRATNCVTRNIAKSVGASAIQVTAIEELMATGLFGRFIAALG